MALLVRFALLSMIGCAPAASVGGDHPANAAAAPGRGHEVSAMPEPVEARPPRLEAPAEPHEHGGHHHGPSKPAEPAKPTKPADPPREPPPARADRERLAYEKARPVFDRYCAKCHASGGEKASKKKLGHFDMTSYPFGGHHAATMGKTIREVLGVEGGEATMPLDEPGVVKGAELDAIVEWSREFDRAHPAGGGGHKH